jgi:hypothetical protein
MLTVRNVNSTTITENWGDSFCISKWLQITYSLIVTLNFERHAVAIPQWKATWLSRISGYYVMRPWLLSAHTHLSLSRKIISSCFQPVHSLLLDRIYQKKCRHYEWQDKNILPSSPSPRIGDCMLCWGRARIGLDRTTFLFCLVSFKACATCTFNGSVYYTYSLTMLLWTITRRRNLLW